MVAAEGAATTTGTAAVGVGVGGCRRPPLPVQRPLLRAAAATPGASGAAASKPAAYASGGRRVTSSVEEDAALDLGSAVMPVLIKRYVGYAAAALVGVVVGWLLGRRGD